MAEITAPQTEGIIDDARARRNALILAVAQTFYGCSAVIIITTAGLVGQLLADNKALATLPVSTFVLGTATMTVPASLLMRRVGRRTGFMTGALLGAAGAALAATAIWLGSFWLFSLATMMTGAYQASSMYYRFAAADVASDAFKPKAISWVLVGGVAAAVLGPQLVIWTRDALAPISFAGVFVTSSIVSLVAVAILAFVDIPLPPRGGVAGEARPLARIITQPKFVVAVACAMVSYGIMSLVMTATPLAMVACDLSVDDAAFVIQWHAIAMFAPSFFTGNLITRFGAPRIIMAGLTLLACCGAVALTGVELERFWIALVLLGLGWNFGFVGATTLVTETYRPAERNAVQAANDFLVFATVATASLMSGALFQLFGWDWVNAAMFPLVGMAAALILWITVRERRLAAA